MDKFDALVVGAGVVGAATAYYLSQRGLKVAVVERNAPCAGASGCAQGDVSYQGKPPPLLRLAGEDPEILSRLSLDLPMDIQRDVRGLLTAALAQEDEEEMETVSKDCHDAGLRPRFLSAREVLDIEPRLTQLVRSGLTLEGATEGFVNPFRLTWALLKASGASLFPGREFLGFETSAGHVSAAFGQGWRVECDVLVVCAGWRFTSLCGLLSTIPVYGKKGHVLVTEHPYPPLARNLFGWRSVKGESGATLELVLTQTSSGTLLVGSTMQNLTDTTLDERVIRDLSRCALEYLPFLKDLCVVRMYTGIRPASPDGLPIMGQMGPPGLYVATGHGGNGIALGPASGRYMARVITGLAQENPCFSPGRFTAGARKA